MSKRKIIFCIQDLSGGGAEKILVETVRKLNPDTYDITVLSLFNDGVYIEDIQQIGNYQYVVPMPKSTFTKKVIKKLLLRVFFRLMNPKMLYKLCVKGQYDVEVAFLEGLATKVISGSSNKRAIKYAWVHSDVAYNSYSRRAYLSGRLEREAYKAFDKILCVSTAARRSFIEKIDIDPSQVEVQLNVLDESVVLEKSKQPTPFVLRPKTLIAVGRLAPEKGFHALVAAASRLRDDGLDFSLLIVGEGSERKRLEDYIRQLELQDTVRLTGFMANPYPLVSQAYAFISSSRTEGFGIAVLEAIILGTPVVATATGGVEDILGDSEYGLITPCTEDGLYEGIKSVLRDSSYRSLLQSQAKSRKRFFNAANRVQELDNLFFANYTNSELGEGRAVRSSTPGVASALVSVVVPVYNVEKYLKTCVESITSQTYKNLEIILVNDGSTDTSGDICDKYAKKDSRIIVIHKENGGLSDARNRGIDTAVGEYIIFIDSDDYIHPRAIELLLNDSLYYGADIAVPGMLNVTTNSSIDYSSISIRKSSSLNPTSALEDMLYQKNITASACKLYNRKLFNSIRYPKGKLCEDLGTTYKLFSKASKVIVNPTPMYYYLQRHDSIIHSDFKPARMDGLAFAHNQLEFIRKSFPSITIAAQDRLFMEAVFIILAMPFRRDVFRNEWHQCINILKKYRWIVLFSKKSRWQHRVYAGLSLVSPRFLHLPTLIIKIVKRRST